VSAAPSVLVVGACQESVAVPVPLLVAEVPRKYRGHGGQAGRILVTAGQHACGDHEEAS